MSEEQPTPRLTPKPTTLQEAIQAHYNAKHYLDWYKQAEKEARTDLADFMCIQDDDYCGKTLDSADGSKIRLKVQRTIKCSEAEDRLRHVMSWASSGEHGMTDALLKDFRRTKVETKVSYSVSGFDNLPDSIREYLQPAIDDSVTLSIEYVPPKDDR